MLYNIFYCNFAFELKKIKDMVKSTIGLNAGLVWKALEQGQSGVKSIKKATKLTEKNLYLALGWLAREGKISFEESENDLLVSLS